jgi:hypothetical protein
MVIVVRAHAGEPPFGFNQLRIPVYELRTDGELTSPFGLLIFCRALIPSEPEYGIAKSIPVDDFLFHFYARSNMRA